MPLISSTTLIHAHTLTSLALSYLLLSSPSTILSADPIWLLGRAMHVRPFGSSSSSSTNSATTPNPDSPYNKDALALVAVVLFWTGLVQSLLCTGLSAPDTTNPTTTSDINSPPAALTSNLPPAAAREAAESKRHADRHRYEAEVYHCLATQAKFLTLSMVRVVLGGIVVVGIYAVARAALRSGAAGGGKSAGDLTGWLSGMSGLCNDVVFTACLVDMLVWGYVYTVVKEERRAVVEGIARAAEAERERER